MANKVVEALGNVYYSLLRRVIETSKLGRNCIEGFAETGYNFDHMYTANPQGEGSFGRFVDKVLLNLPAAKATRGRKETIKGLVKEVLSERQGMPITIVDLASGPSRYLLEAVEEADINGDYHLSLVDRDSRSLQLAEQLAKEKNICCSLEFLQGDATDTRLLGRLKTPDLIIASGLYVYIPDDKQVEQSLRDISQIAAIDGRLIVDNQISNPSEKLMERLGKTTSGEAWKLAYRSEGRMKSIVSKYFSIMNSTIDQWNMYHIIMGENQNGRPN